MSASIVDTVILYFAAASLFAVGLTSSSSFCHSVYIGCSFPIMQP
jgi:hypothetical protein